jgi:hypothetical protein
MQARWARISAQAAFSAPSALSACSRQEASGPAAESPKAGPRCPADFVIASPMSALASRFSEGSAGDCGPPGDGLVDGGCLAAPQQGTVIGATSELRQTFGPYLCGPGAAGVSVSTM